MSLLEKYVVLLEEISITEGGRMNYVIVGIVILLIGLFCKPIRKAMGLLLIIIGAILSLTGLGLIIGVPMIFFGAIMLFWKKGSLTFFSTYSSDSKKFSYKQEELVNAILTTLDNLGWKYEVVSQTYFQAKIPMSFYSFGEKMDINIFPDGAIHVKSSCSQLYDWGKNKKNIETFFSELGRVIDNIKTKA